MCGRRGGLRARRYSCPIGGRGRLDSVTCGVGFFLGGVLIFSTWGDCTLHNRGGRRRKRYRVTSSLAAQETTGACALQCGGGWVAVAALVAEQAAPAEGAPLTVTIRESGLPTRAAVAYQGAGAAARVWVDCTGVGGQSSDRHCVFCAGGLFFFFKCLGTGFIRHGACTTVGSALLNPALWKNAIWNMAECPSSRACRLNWA